MLPSGKSGKPAWRIKSIVILLALAFQAPISPLLAASAPADRLDALFDVVRKCLDDVRGPEGSELTIQFSGELLGRPRIAFVKLPDNQLDRAQFAITFAAAMDRCFPVSITDSLGGAIAGRQFRMTFTFKVPQTEI